MEFSWMYSKTNTQQIKFFLKDQGISRGLLAKIKFQNGKILVNGTVQNVLYSLKSGDEVTVEIPDEKEHETLQTEYDELDIAYEDEHYLVINKPSNIASIPSQYHPNHTMANRVKGYYKQQNYKNLVIHVVTRLDRDTTGLMLFAKHGFAHARLDQELRKKKVLKIYHALVSNLNNELKNHDLIKLPIGRDLTSLLKRKVTLEGKDALTEYWTEKKDNSTALVKIQLHTGRTHQIRVHFDAIGCSLLGDSLYNGEMDLGITRQALHCSELRFFHPFKKQEIEIFSSLPKDMKQIADCL